MGGQERLGRSIAPASLERALGSPAGVGAGDAGRSHRDRPPPLLASLRLLAELRMVALCGQAAAIATAVQLGVVLRWPLMASVVGMLVLANLAVWVRLRRGGPATYREIGVHLVFDLGAFTVLLLSAGGAANPFVLLYVLHAVLFALLLPWMLAIAGVALVVAAVTGAAAWRSPLLMHDGSPLPAFLRSLGDWTSIALTVLVAAWIVARIAASLRDQQRQLAEAERHMSRDEMVMRVGVLAAGAAHELATPMTTMTVVAGEMQHENDVAALKRDAAVLATQIAACRHTLDNLMATAAHARAQAEERIAVDRLLESVAHRFGALRPDAGLTLPLERRSPGAGDRRGCSAGAGDPDPAQQCGGHFPA